MTIPSRLPIPTVSFSDDSEAAFATGLRMCRLPEFEVWRFACSFCGEVHDVSTDRDTRQVFDELDCWSGELFMAPDEDSDESWLWLDATTGACWPLNVIVTQ